jgi:hypothetical protein
MEGLGFIHLGHNIIFFHGEWRTRKKNPSQEGGMAGRSLSPMMFLLAMEPLQLLFKYAQITGVLDRLHANCNDFRISVYVDDAAVFINPTKHDSCIKPYP